MPRPRVFDVTAIVPGFYPDPSICRGADAFYLATSSFEYLPAVPILRSVDLLSWEHIGNALDRPEQLDFPAGVAASGGIFAPTLRYRDHRYWLVTTNVVDPGGGQLVVWASDPKGPWSDPIIVRDARGFDPDLAWGPDGECLLTWRDLDEGIVQSRVDLVTGRMLDRPVRLWRGTGLGHTEGPHVIRRGDWWYLIVAEGGTHAGHGVSVGRSRSPRGPFEEHPDNPIFTHRSTTHPVQAVGHADLVELADDEWAMVHLGIRQRGRFPRFHVNGRETFLADVSWIDDWPVVRDRARLAATPATSVDADFSRPPLAPVFFSPGVHPSDFTSFGEGGLRMRAGRPAESTRAQHLLGVRTRDEYWRAHVQARGDIALIVRIDDAHWAGIERAGSEVRARMVVGPLDQILATRHVAPDVALELRTLASTAGGPDVISMGVVDEGLFRPLAAVDGRYVSTEVAGGFTGRVVGFEALGTDATIEGFVYEADSGEAEAWPSR